MNTLIIDNATLSATKLKYLLKNRDLNSSIISAGKITNIKEIIANNMFQDISYVFISVYLGNDLYEFINNFVVKRFPYAHIILTYVKENVIELPPTSLVGYDGVLGQPFNDKELDSLLLRIETQ